MRRSRLLVATIVAAAATSTWLGASPARSEQGLGLGPLDEVANLLVTTERPRQDLASGLMGRVAEATARYQRSRSRVDPGRHPDPNFCTIATVIACPTDPRLTHWASLGGRVRPVLFTARTGATLSGHVWATRSGPRQRPAVLLINGSILGTEQMLWFAAQALARAGYVVMTFDAQGEGMSDQFGEGPDRIAGSAAGTPLLSLPQTHSLGGSGEPFYDGGEDALDFLLSTPARPYRPVRSRSSGTSHVAKQRHRVAAGLDAAYDPLWGLIDRRNVGVAGWSYGAEAASWLAQRDRRLSAAVAWDTLCVPISPSPDEAAAILADRVNRAGLFGLSRDCFGAPPGPAPRITKPALGISADYLLTPEPYLVPPDPTAKTRASSAYSKAGVDTGQIVIRGGTHLDFADLPGLYATARGIDLVTWYTVAWFDKYLRHDAAADRMLLSSLWRTDAATARVDPRSDGNLYSRHYLSRLDITLRNGRRFDCEDLRSGCAGQVAPSEDCGPRPFGFVAVDRGKVRLHRCAARS